MNLGGFHQRAPRIGNTIDTAMHVVTVWVTLVVLRVPNKGIMPVGNVKRAVGRELQVNWAEVGVC